jgi:hypothetical protein
MRVGLHGLDLALSDTVRAANPAQLHYVACVEHQTKLVESCAYNFGYSVHRNRQYWLATLRDARTGAVVARKSIAGPAPEGCSFSETFQIGQSVKTKSGGLPTIESLEAWLKPFTK